jgi:hypothetical protein
MEHECLNIGVVRIQNLVDQEVDYVAVSAAEPRHELGTVGCRLQGEAREVDPRRPALGAFDECFDLRAFEAEPE